MFAESVRYPYPVKTIDIGDNIEIAYTDEGQGGETLVFIHGLANYLPVWKANIEVLKSRYRCIAIDLPGNGKSSRGDYPCTMQFFALCVAKFIKTMNLDEVTLVGHSMGGQVSVITALANPSVVKRLVLCAPAGFEEFTPGEKSMFLHLMHFGDLFLSEEGYLKNIIRQSFYKFPQAAQDFIDQLVAIQKSEKIKDYRRMVERCIDGMLSEPVFKFLKALQCPVLLIYGENDRLIPNILFHHYSTKELAEKAIKEIPDGKLLLVPKCGHFVHYEAAPQVNKAIEEFIV